MEFAQGSFRCHRFVCLAYAGSQSQNYRIWLLCIAWQRRDGYPALSVIQQRGIIESDDAAKVLFMITKHDNSVEDLGHLPLCNPDCGFSSHANCLGLFALLLLLGFHSKKGVCIIIGSLLYYFIHSVIYKSYDLAMIADSHENEARKTFTFTLNCFWT